MKPSCIALAALLVGLTGCGEYPTGDATPGRTTSEERLEIMERKLDEGTSPVRSLSLPTPCILRVRWVRGETDFSLLQLETRVDTEPATSRFLVFLATRGSTEPGVLFFSTPDWADMMVLRSELNQLRAHCAESQSNGG